MGRSKYGVIARLVWDGGDDVLIPEEMGRPRGDQMCGTPGERLSELSGRCCYDSLGKGRSSDEYHKHILEVGHFSVYEHHQMTVFVGDEGHDGRSVPAGTLLNRPGLWTRTNVKRGIRLTFNPRVMLDWDQWSEPDDADAVWLKDVLLYHAEQEWPRITPTKGRTAENCASVTLCSRRVAPEHDEERWVALFLSGSRGYSHEGVRHRFRTGVSQRSTRFVDEDGSPWIHHPLVQEFNSAKDADAELQGRIDTLIHDTMHLAGETYRRTADALQKWLMMRGVEKLTARKQARAAARGYLGNALSTELVFSASIAQWKRMLRLRCSDPADAEIRAVFAEALKELKRSRYAEDFEAFELRPSADGIGEVAVERHERPS